MKILFLLKIVFLLILIKSGLYSQSKICFDSLQAVEINANLIRLQLYYEKNKLSESIILKQSESILDYQDIIKRKEKIETHYLEKEVLYKQTINQYRKRNVLYKIGIGILTAIVVYERFNK